MSKATTIPTTDPNHEWTHNRPIFFVPATARGGTMRLVSGPLNSRTGFTMTCCGKDFQGPNFVNAVARDSGPRDVEMGAGKADSASVQRLSRSSPLWHSRERFYTSNLLALNRRASPILADRPSGRPRPGCRPDGPLGPALLIYLYGQQPEPQDHGLPIIFLAMISRSAQLNL